MYPKDMGVPKKQNQPLTPKEDLFLEKYLRHWNGARAAREAGYPSESAKQTAHELLTKPYFIAAKAERLKELHMETDEWYARVTAHARGDIGDLIEDDGSVNLKKAREDNNLRLVSEYQVETSHRRDEEGEPVPVTKIKLKLYSAQKALDMLGKREDKSALLEAQTLLLQQKLDQLAEREALLVFLKEKATPEVYQEVVRVLTGGAKDQSKEGGTTLRLQWRDARPTHQAESEPTDSDDREP